MGMSEVSDIRKRNLKPVKTNVEELEAQIRRHKQKNRRIFLWVTIIVILLLVLLVLFTLIRTYDSYKVEGSYEQRTTEAVRYQPFEGGILKYSNDGIIYLNHKNKVLWNQSFEMANPLVAICGKNLAVYDRGGSVVYIMSTEGLRKKLDVILPVQTVDIAGQGTIAVLMKEETVSHVKLYDNKGKELAQGEFYGEQGGFPMDIALSEDATKLAVDMLDVREGRIKTTISFYNFGSVGQNEIDNNVGNYSYEDTVIPEIQYSGSDRLIAICDNQVLVFGGKQKPKLEHEFAFESEIEYLFHNGEYIGILTPGTGEKAATQLQVYDMNGKSVMKVDTELALTHAEFLDNNEVCVRSQDALELYNLHGIKKFSYTFDSRLHAVGSSGGRAYTFVLEDVIQEVKLQ